MKDVDHKAYLGNERVYDFSVKTHIFCFFDNHLIHVTRILLDISTFVYHVQIRQSQIVRRKKKFHLAKSI